MIEAMLMGGGEKAPPGEVVFTTTGAHIWVVPAGVKEVSVVCVGGGRGYAAVSSRRNSHFGYTVYAYGSDGMTGGGFSGADGGGNGGNGGQGSYSAGSIYAGGGGGGAGGYSGDGGSGGDATSSAYTGSGTRDGGSGGGVGLYGEGPSGSGGLSDNNTLRSGSDGSGGGGGGGAAAANGSVRSYGQPGLGGSYGEDGRLRVNTGGLFGGGYTHRGNGGGGGGLAYKNSISVIPGESIQLNVGVDNGAVRIMWGKGRAFPDTMTGEEYSDTVERY